MWQITESAGGSGSTSATSPRPPTYLQRSALTLEGADLLPPGATAKAPRRCRETLRGERNWDYRYAWIRDSTFALWGSTPWD